VRCINYLLFSEGQKLETRGVGRVLRSLPSTVSYLFIISRMCRRFVSDGPDVLLRQPTVLLRMLHCDG
jgi:hypothetical protein